MKIACTADWHVHAFQEFSKKILVSWNPQIMRFVSDLQGKEINSRLFNILDGICDIRDFCLNAKIKYVLNAGDIFHKRGVIQVEAFNALSRVLQSFKESGLNLIMISGNHDQVDSSSIPETSIHTLSKYSTVIESPKIITLEGLNVVCIPFSNNRDFILFQIKQCMDSFNKEELRKSILLAHLGVTGSQVGSGSFFINDEFKLTDLCYDKFQYVILGHYHRPQLLAHNTLYCGSPVQNNFSDELPSDESGGYNGFFIIDSDQNWDIQFIPIRKPRFRTVSSQDEVDSEIDFFRLKAKSVESIPEDSIKENVRVEVEKSYESVSRSSIDITDSFESAVTKYALEHNQPPEVINLGLQILNQARKE